MCDWISNAFRWGIPAAILLLLRAHEDSCPRRYPQERHSETSTPEIPALSTAYGHAAPAAVRATTNWRPCELDRINDEYTAVVPPSQIARKDVTATGLY